MENTESLSSTSRSTSLEGDESWIWSICLEGIAPDPLLTVSEWADKYRILSEKASGEPGQWRTDRTPYLRFIMDALSPGSPYEEVDFMKGAQIGATECGLNFLGFIMDHMPGPAMCVMPTVETMQKNSKTRIAPMIYDCPRLREKVSDPRSRDSGNTILMKEFQGGHLAMIGANSPVGFRSMPARFGFADEVDGYPRDVGDEGDSLALFRRAFRNFPNRKLFICSTPTIEGDSRISDAYESTGKWRYWVPCLHCGELQVLKWAQVKWPENEPEKAFYACEHCGAILYNHDKTEMLARGEWRPDAPNYRGKKLGVHLSSLYSPVGWYSWGDAAAEFWEAKDDPSKLKQWVNTVLGETWKEQGEVPDWERLYSRREKYERGTVPGGAFILTAGADVQRDRIEVSIVGWGRDKENWLIDHRVFPGNTADLNCQAYKSLDLLLTEGFKHECGLTLHIRALGIDTGGTKSDSGVSVTQVIYNWVRRHQPDRVLAMKGMDSLASILGQPKAVDVYKDGKRHKNALKLWGVGVSHVKGEFYGWLRMPAPTDGEPFQAGHCHHPDMEEEYFRQITAEQLICRELKNSQRRVYEWKKIRDRNEGLDCWVYARAAAAMLQIDRFQGVHWDKLEGAICGKQSAVSGQPSAGGEGRTSNVQRSTSNVQRRGRRQLSRGIG